MKPLHWYEKHTKKVEELRYTVSMLDDTLPDSDHPIMELAKRTLGVADAIVELQKDVGTRRKRVFVCSPLAPKLPEGLALKLIEADALDAELQVRFLANQKRAEMYCARVAAEGHRPFAPHLFYTRFLNDFDPQERLTGFEMGVEDLEECDELWYWDTPSKGMTTELEHCKRRGIPVRFMADAIDVEAIVLELKNGRP